MSPNGYHRYMHAVGSVTEFSDKTGIHFKSRPGRVFEKRFFPDVCDKIGSKY